MVAVYSFCSFHELQWQAIKYIRCESLYLTQNLNICAFSLREIQVALDLKRGEQTTLLVQTNRATTVHDFI